MQPPFFTVKIGVFYVIYYAFLSAYFTAMMYIFYQTLDDNEPKWKGPERGIIGENPGLCVTPAALTKKVGRGGEITNDKDGKLCPREEKFTIDDHCM